VSTEVHLHPLGREDIPAWNLLLAEIEKVDRTGEHYNEADLAEEMDNPDIELGKDLVGAFRGDELVGYFCVYPRSAAEQWHKIVLDGGVRPDARGQGVGSLLARAMRTRALQAHRERHPDLGAHLSLRRYDESLAAAMHTAHPRSAGVPHGRVRRGLARRGLREPHRGPGHLRAGRVRGGEPLDRLRGRGRGGQMTTRRTWMLLGAVVGVLLLSSCAAGPNPAAGAGQDPVGFWYGLWHGFIIPVTFVISLFTDEVSIYEVRNTGGWYDLGYVVGLSLIFSGGGGAAGRRR
jgi:GNAT superfamily N-acetyltransferase